MSLFLSNAPLKVLCSLPRLRRHVTSAVACTVIGALLMLQGYFGATSLQSAVADLNINIAWGAVLVAFGAAMLLLRR